MSIDVISTPPFLDRVAANPVLALVAVTLVVCLVFVMKFRPFCGRSPNPDLMTGSWFEHVGLAVAIGLALMVVFYGAPISSVDLGATQAALEDSYEVTIDRFGIPPTPDSPPRTVWVLTDDGARTPAQVWREADALSLYRTDDGTLVPWMDSPRR